MSGSEGMKEGDREKNPASLSRVSSRAHSSCLLSACYTLGTALGTALSHFTLTTVLPILQIWKRAQRSYGTCLPEVTQPGVAEPGFALFEPASHPGD